MEEFAIDCRVVSLEDNDPLILFPDSEAGILLAAIPHPRPCPKGINIDGMIVFDMQEDGGLDSIEILYKLPVRYRSRRKSPFLVGGKYCRILLHANRAAAYSPEVTPAITWKGDLLRLTVGNGEPDRRCKLGPDTSMFLLKNRLIGIEFDLSSFAD